jgi:hypothetical protein
VGTTPTGQEVKGRGDRAPADKNLVAGTVAASNAFGADLYRSLAAGRGNFVYAPFALETALAMARAGSGTGSVTRTELDALLHAPQTADLDGGINSVQQTIQARSGERRSDTRKGKVSFEQSESLWGQRGTHFKEEYLDTLATNYGTGVHAVDFRSDAESIVRPWSGRAVPFQRLDDQPVQPRTIQVAAPSGSASPIGGLTATSCPTSARSSAWDVNHRQFGFREHPSPRHHPVRRGGAGAASLSLRLPQLQFTTATNSRRAAPGHLRFPGAWTSPASRPTRRWRSPITRGVRINERHHAGTPLRLSLPTPPARGPAAARPVISPSCSTCAVARPAGLLLGRVVNPG